MLTSVEAGAEPVQGSVHPCLMISLVIPTYNEAPVVEITLRRATEVLKTAGEPFELIVVDDDSPDGTAAIVEGLAAELPVRVICRKGERGLATAVVRGWGAARGDVVGVMDADLQHPPEVVCQLIKALRAEDADIAVASRYLPGGGTEGWSRFRLIVSWAGMRLGTVALPWTLGAVTDSGSGLFLVRKRVVEGADLKPRGIKMLLEVLAKARYRKIVEVPYVFRGRTLGVSKVGPRQGVEYLKSLLRMGRDSGELKAWILYALSGLVGAMVYIAALLVLTERAEWPLLVVILLSIQIALVVEFVADDLVSFAGRREGGVATRHFRERIMHYEGGLLPGALLNALVTYLACRLGLDLWAAALLGVIVALPWNFLVAAPRVWRVWRTMPPRVVAAENKV